MYMARSRFFVAPKVAVVRYPPSTPVGRRSALVCVLLGSRVAPVQIQCSCLALVWVLLGSHVAPAQIPRGSRGALIYLEPNKRKRTNTVSNRRSVT